jgi:hypothetical protein
VDLFLNIGMFAMALGALLGLARLTGGRRPGEMPTGRADR